MGFNLWNGGIRGDDYKFIDMVIKEQFDVGGTTINIHKYIGVKDTNTQDATQPNYTAQGGSTEVSIQDLLFLENRDRKYDENIYEMNGVYNVQDNDFDLRQFGFFLTGDNLFISFHYTDMILKLGRKLMSGDVLELPHLRDFDPLNPDTPPINKYYVVEDASRSSEGFSPTWHYHIWRVKVKPMTDTQEYEDIMNSEDENSGLDLRSILSTFQNDIGISDAIKEQVMAEVPQWNFETAHLYIVPGAEDGKQYPWIFAGDGEPPNGAELGGKGSVFPTDAPEGTWFLREDYEPPVLYRKEENFWRRKEVDYRRKYSSAHRILESFLNNQKTSILDASIYTPGTPVEQRQAISKVAKPKADF